MTHLARTIALALAIAITLGALPLAASAAGVVNINTASAEQLAMLPRVGPAVAERIVEHREGNGKFKSPEDLLLVRGIGEKTFELIKPHVTLSGETTLKEKVRTPRATAEERP